MATSSITTNAQNVQPKKSNVLKNLCNATLGLSVAGGVAGTVGGGWDS